MAVEEAYTDVLQNIEFAIVQEYRNDGMILDMEARDAVNALIRHYEAELESRTASHTPLSSRAGRIFESVRKMCEWRLGREPGAHPEPDSIPSLKVDVIVLCLKRIRKSIDRWNKEHGRQGYLNFVSQYVA